MRNIDYDKRKLILDLFNQIDNLQSSEYSVHNLLRNKKIILYGAGQLGIAFLNRIIWRYNFKLQAVIDKRFKIGDSFYGIPAFSPFTYKPKKKEKKDAIVVVCVGNKRYYKEIFKSLYKLGFKDIILAPQIYEFLLVRQVPELEKPGFKYYYLKNKDAIIKCLNLFSDDLSKEVYFRFIKTHILRKPLEMREFPYSEQYFPKDIKLNKGYSRFIQCGAYNGDTIRRLNTLLGKTEAIACFEPDEKNFKLLRHYLYSKYKRLAKEIIAFPCGVFSHTCKQHFAGGNGPSSAISQKGDSLIQCVALDDVLFNYKPTFIAMDIEGVELEALRGAERMIRKSKPDLAISVYHSPHQIWEIPFYIKKLNPKYKLYLRSYSWFVNDIVLYSTL